MTVGEFINLLLKDSNIKLSDNIYFEMEDGTIYNILKKWPYDKTTNTDNEVYIHLN